MKLGITEFIDCAHFLPGHPKCGQLHGHTYKVEVVIEGEHAPGQGMIVDFNDLKLRTREVLHRYDHRNWNDVLEFPSVADVGGVTLTQTLDEPPAAMFGVAVIAVVQVGSKKVTGKVPPLEDRL